MAGLACRKPLPAAGKTLSWLTRDFVTFPESCAVRGMRAPASGLHGGIPIVSSESSPASMETMLEASREPALCEDLPGLRSDEPCPAL
ncbi:hypothetical protein F5Y01DRAFT_229394 [Xylaria sp. FL0043]|nr:hypothetical protein F5Y01DRAFT_229394 [Xylaria sp. FL0043]